MSEKQQEACLITHACGGLLALGITEPRNAVFIGKEVRKAIKHGDRVQFMPLEEARATPFCECYRANKRKAKGDQP